MTSPACLTPRKTPTQTRARASYEAILVAAARILEHGGWPALTTNLVAERAGVGIGTLYQYFPNKETIAAELVRRQRAEMRADIREAVAGCDVLDLGASAHKVLCAAIRHHARTPRLSRILEDIEERLPLDNETRTAKALMLAEIAGLLERFGVPAPQTAAADLSAMSAGMVHAALERGEDDVQAITRRVFRAVCGYLGLDAVSGASLGW
jgi:AcrR family transcriptional regulator